MSFSGCDHRKQTFRINRDTVCTSITEIQCSYGLQSAILICAGRPTLGYVGSVTINTRMVENVRKADGISAMSFHSRDTVYFRFGVHHFELR
jgi:hypothetical protein